MQRVLSTHKCVPLFMTVTWVRSHSCPKKEKQWQFSHTVARMLFKVVMKKEDTKEIKFPRAARLLSGAAGVEANTGPRCWCVTGNMQHFAFAYT